MSPSVPATTDDWHAFFRSLADQDVPKDRESDRARYFAAAYQAGHAGTEPADAGVIAAVEGRLGIRLPPSFRNFLLVSNGWNDVAHSKVEELRGVEEIGWLPQGEPGLLEAWWPDVLDDEEADQLRRCLLVSGPGNGDYWLLDPDNVADDSEWPAYEWWASSGGDLIRHDSFAALLVSVRDEYVAEA